MKVEVLFEKSYTVIGSDMSERVRRFGQSRLNHGSYIPVCEITTDMSNEGRTGIKVVPLRSKGLIWKKN